MLRSDVSRARVHVRAHVPARVLLLVLLLMLLVVQLQLLVHMVLRSQLLARWMRAPAHRCRCCGGHVGACDGLATLMAQRSLLVREQVLA